VADLNKITTEELGEGVSDKLEKEALLKDKRMTNANKLDDDI
jgi:hypothetical protein